MPHLFPYYVFAFLLALASYYSARWSRLTVSILDILATCGCIILQLVVVIKVARYMERQSFSGPTLQVAEFLLVIMLLWYALWTILIFLGGYWPGYYEIEHKRGVIRGDSREIIRRYAPYFFWVWIVGFTAAMWLVKSVPS